MEITWKKVTGCQPQKPPEIDTISSPTTVYLRKNINQTEISSEEGSGRMWEYEEAQLSLLEYAAYQAEVEECATMANKETRKNNEIIMEAIADTYNQQLELQGNQVTIMEAIADIYTIMGKEE